jgi:hypothetical protein
MLEFLRGRMSDRKLRLFACACVRQLGVVAGPARLSALRICEQYADGLADRASLDSTLVAARQLPEPIPFDADMALSVFGPTDMRYEASLADLFSGLGPALDTRDVTKRALEVVAQGKVAEEKRHQVYLLHDVFGNPFRPCAADPAWLTRNDGAVTNLARAIYHNRAFGRLPELADALEEAGCPDGELLGHLRGPGPHVRGCWAVDLLLGKS